MSGFKKAKAKETEEAPTLGEAIQDWGAEVWDEAWEGPLLDQQPVEIFGQLETGSMYGTEFIYQEAKPVDGSNPRLRKYSPFVIRFLPPTELYGAEATAYERLTGADPSLGSKAYEWESSSDFLGRPVDDVPRTMVSGGRVFAARAEKVIFGGKVRGRAQLSIASTMECADQLIQLRNIREMPPLVMLINPSSFQISFQKVQSNTRTRNGYVFQEWGEGQPTISLSGKIGAFLSGNARPIEQEGRRTNTLNGKEYGKDPGAGLKVPSGNREASRKYSAAWHNFLSLMQVYKSNGYIKNTLTSSENVHMVCPIAIDYDGWTYVGSFNSLNYSFSDEKNRGGIEYDMEFTVSRRYDNTEQITFVNRMNHGDVSEDGRSPRRSLSRQERGVTVGVTETRSFDEAMAEFESAVREDLEKQLEGNRTKGFKKAIKKLF